MPYCCHYFIIAAVVAAVDDNNDDSDVVCQPNLVTGKSNGHTFTEVMTYH